MLKMLGTIAFAVSLLGNVFSQDVYTVAVLPFSERGSGITEQGAQVGDLMFAELVKNPNIWMVERAEMEKIMEELQLNASGMVSQDQAAKIGQLTGAKILVTGSIFKIKDKTFIVGKVIGTETSRVMGDSVNGNQGLQELSDKLSKKLNSIINAKAKDLMPKIKERKEIIADLKNKIGSAGKPVVYIKIDEQYIGQPSVDPAAQTEMQLICKELGFTVTENPDDAEIKITGEGFSEFATRKGDIVSVKARLEVKAVDKDGSIVAVDRQTDVNAGTAEQTTAKAALQEASAQIAERLIPKIVKK